jgi:hypothetical protein
MGLWDTLNNNSSGISMFLSEALLAYLVALKLPTKFRKFVYNVTFILNDLFWNHT